MLKNGVAIRRSRHHWFSGLRPAAGGKIPTTHFRGQAQVTLLSTLQRRVGSGAEEENCRLLQLQNLVERSFKLPTRSTHRAIVTGIRLKREIGKKYFTSEYSCSRTDLIEILGWSNADMPTAGLGEVASVRIELELGTGRFDRKTSRSLCSGKSLALVPWQSRRHLDELNSKDSRKLIEQLAS